MRFHRVTLLIGDKDVEGDPGEWDWQLLDVAPLVYLVDSVPISRDETPFDRKTIKEIEKEEEWENQWNRDTQ